MNGSCLQQREAHAAHAAHAPQLSSHVSSYPYMFHHDPLHPLGSAVSAAYNPRAPSMAHQSHQAHHAGYGAAHSSVPTSTGEYRPAACSGDSIISARVRPLQTGHEVKNSKVNNNHSILKP